MDSDKPCTPALLRRIVLGSVLMLSLLTVGFVCTPVDRGEPQVTAKAVVPPAEPPFLPAHDDVGDMLAVLLHRLQTSLTAISLRYASAIAW